MNVVGSEFLAKSSHCRCGRTSGFGLITPPYRVGKSSCAAKLGKSERFPVVSGKGDKPVIKVRLVFEEVDCDHIHTQVIPQEFNQFRCTHISCECLGPAAAGLMNASAHQFDAVPQPHRRIFKNASAAVQKTDGSFLLKTETLKESIGAGCCDVEKAR